MEKINNIKFIVKTCAFFNDVTVIESIGDKRNLMTKLNIMNGLYKGFFELNLLLIQCDKNS